MSDQEEAIDLIPYLSRAWNRERIAKPISTVDKDFYLRYNEFIDSDSYTEKEKERNEIEMNSFFRKRMAFIANCAATTPLTDKFENQLTHEETIIYKQIHELVSSFKENIRKVA